VKKVLMKSFICLLFRNGILNSQIKELEIWLIEGINVFLVDEFQRACIHRSIRLPIKFLKKEKCHLDYFIRMTKINKQII